jgi:hypothetical protein
MNVLLESPFASISAVGRAHPSLVSLDLTLIRKQLLSRFQVKYGLVTLFLKTNALSQPNIPTLCRRLKNTKQ